MIRRPPSSTLFPYATLFLSLPYRPSHGFPPDRRAAVRAAGRSTAEASGETTDGSPAKALRRQILVSGGPGHTELLEAGLEPLGRDADGDGPREVERRVRLLFRHHGVAALGQPRQRRLAHARGDEHVAALRVQPWRLDRLLQRAAPVHEVGDDLRYRRDDRTAARRADGEVRLAAFSLAPPP